MHTAHRPPAGPVEMVGALEHKRPPQHKEKSWALGLTLCGPESRGLTPQLFPFWVLELGPA